MEKRCSFELFKGNVRHRLKREGDIAFLIETLEKNMIREYYNRKWYLESFYLLGMFDYICRVNNASVCSEYDDLRMQTEAGTCISNRCSSYCTCYAW